MWSDFLLYAVIPVVSINLIGYLMGYFLQTDKFTDASYSLSFLSVVWTYVLLSDGGQVLLVYALLVTIWALRLGGFLLYRIIEMGKDDRFDEMRSGAWSFAKFLILQTISVLIIVSPIMVLGDMEWQVLHYVGIAIFGIGWILEARADAQKFSAKKKDNSVKPWDLPGLWTRLRYPNYTGEIMVWLGLAIYCIPSMTGLQYLLLISPVWIITLLVGISGIPLTRQSREERYGDKPEYREYLERTDRLVPGVY